MVFLDEKHGVIGGNEGFIRYTRNGGITWHKPTFESPLTPMLVTDDVQKIVAHEDTIYLVSYKRILQSNDGGARWSLINTPPPAEYAEFGQGVTTYFYDAAFAGDDGWVLGATFNAARKFVDNFVLRLKLDTSPADVYVQRLLADGPKMEMLQIYFTDSKHGWIVGTKGRILRTKNGGDEWEPQTKIRFSSTNTRGSDWDDPPPPSNVESAADRPSFYGVYFRDRERGWIVGDNATILFTEDGGKNWWPASIQGLTPGIKTSTFNQVQFLESDERFGWVVGTNGTILKSIDGGRTWLAPFPLVTQTLYTIQMYEKSGWGAGAGDTLLHYDACQDMTSGAGARGDYRARRKGNQSSQCR